MASITISDLALYPDSESFITEINELNSSTSEGKEFLLELDDDTATAIVGGRKSGWAYAYEGRWDLAFRVWGVI